MLIFFQSGNHNLWEWYTDINLCICAFMFCNFACWKVVNNYILLPQPMSEISSMNVFKAAGNVKCSALMEGVT